jgi:ABC-type spermidine/putrescine transport system permease subunit II
MCECVPDVVVGVAAVRFAFLMGCRWSDGAACGSGRGQPGCGEGFSATVSSALVLSLPLAAVAQTVGVEGVSLQE